jgi:hypothetical protein
MRSLVEAHRRDRDELVRLALTDLAVVWRGVTTGEAAREALMDTLPALAGTYGTAATALSADWYDDMRDAAAVRGRFAAVPAELPDRGRTDSLARWGIGPLFAAEPDFAAAKTLVDGGFQRIVADAGRNTVIGSLKEDPRGRGWSRQTSGSACGFCEMLAGRGAVYSADTADFQSHDHCFCVAVPRW